MSVFLRLGKVLHYVIGLLVASGFQLFYEILTVKMLLIAGAVVFLYAMWRWWRKNDVQQILLLLILGLALGLGMLQLDMWPMRIHPDESLSAALLLEDLKKIESAEYASFDGLLRGMKSHPAVGHWWKKNQIHAARLSYLVPVGSHLYWLVMKFRPVSYVSARLAMVITGMLTVLMVFLLMRRMFGSRIALIAAFFQAVSPWNLALSRIFLNYAPTNFYAVLYLYVLWRATQQFLFYPLLAVILMFSVSMYSSIKAVYYFTPVYLVYYLWSSRKEFLKTCRGLLVFVFIVWLLLLPGYTSLKMLFGYHQSGADFIGRGTFNESVSKLWAGFTSLRKEMYSFSWKNYFKFSRRNYIELGLRFNPIILALSLLGVGICLVKVKKKESVFLLLWLVFAMAPDVGSSCGAVNRRATLLISPLMCLAAVGLGALTHWPKWNRKIGIILVCVVVLVTSIAGYFVMYWLFAEDSYSKDMIKMHGWMEFFQEQYYGRFVYFYGCSGVSDFLMRNSRLGSAQRGYTAFCLWNRKDGKLEKSVARGTTDLKGLKSPFVVMVMDKPENKGVLEELKNLYPEHKISEFSQKHSNGWVLRVTAFSVG